MNHARAVDGLSSFRAAREGSWRVEPFGIGRIHETWAVTPGGSSGDPSFLLQSVNLTVFPDYQALMHNVELVSRHLHSPLRFEPTEEGLPFHRDQHGAVWRLMRFVPESMPVPVPTSPEQAAEAARAYGEFAVGLASLDATRVKPTIPGFHDTPRRVRALWAAADSAATVTPESRELLGWVAEREARFAAVVSRLDSGALPLRVCHNDAKADNVLIHRETGRRLCVVDLDTVMPGSPVYDIGDLLRSSAASLGEDDPDVANVNVRWDSAEAILAGFLETGRAVLTDEERRLLRIGGWMLAGEQAIRYLTDHLMGNRYYRVEYAGQNLDRARNQAALATGFEREGWAPEA